ncbi:NAD(P)-dependent alcohol dehydrogenase [Nonomuraea rhizosphaerae]|uniref:NAD(P)-dependent alcohol dehydrogenase n=1 Tax=Nonomuraea rhizosphaerae TaxID=2665663 RepID=UPI001C5DEA86|nr:NAD(P)-dependent alcohol dehydrogenase [Nonomuraea rhizosphaerae]
MKAFQLVAPGKAEITEVDVPEPGPGEVLLEVTGSGVCHSDLHLLHVEGLPFPMTLGHEPAGRVAAAGPDVTGWDTGATAIGYLAWGCGVCRQCAVGAENVCERFPRAFPPGPGLGYPGAMAEYMLFPARALVPLGDLDPVESAPLADAGLTPYHAIVRSRDLLTPSATAVVIGVGGLGHMAVQILRAVTGSRIVAVDVDPARLRAARTYGADEALVSDGDVTAAILDLTGGVGADVVLDFVGSQATMAIGAATIASYGDLAVVGLAGGTLAFGGEITARGLPWGVTVSTPYGGTRRDLHEVLALARQGRIKAQVERHPLADAAAVLDRLEAGQVQGRAVLIP